MLFVVNSLNLEFFWSNRTKLGKTWILRGVSMDIRVKYG